jgi:DNA-directed RNA polymerase omega subunit
MGQQTDAPVDETIENAELHNEVNSKYRLILIAAQRSKQLQRGAHPRIDADPRTERPTRIAMKEFQAGKVEFEYTDRKR